MIDKIRERLNNATPGPWEYVDDDCYGGIESIDGEFITGGDPNEGRLELDDPNVLLIANAPTDIAYLLNLNEEKDELITALLKELRGLCWACKHSKPWELRAEGSLTVTCGYMQAEGAVARGGRGGKNCEHWEWRGIQEANDA